MPWKIEKRPSKEGKEWAILKKVNGEWRIVGRSSSKSDAEASVRARYASENEQRGH